MVKGEKSLFDILVLLLLVFSAIIIISPVVIVVALSCRDGIQAYSNFFIWKPDLLYSLSNSVLIASTASIGTDVVSLPAGFILAKKSFKYRNLIFTLYTAMMIIPFQMIMFPQYDISQKLHIYDTLSAVILPRIFAPFGVFLLTQSIKQINNEILEAAELETSSMLRIFINIIIPMIRPALLSVWVISFCENWNAVSEPLVFLESSEKMPIAINLDSVSLTWTFGFAATVVYMVLPLLIYSVFDTDIQEGLGELKVK